MDLTQDAHGKVLAQEAAEGEPLQRGEASRCPRPPKVEAKTEKGSQLSKKIYMALSKGMATQLRARYRVSDDPEPKGSKGPQGRGS